MGNARRERDQNDGVRTQQGQSKSANSGHTHGGQVRLLGWSPVVPSRFGNRYAYGHIRERSDLIVSAGLGCSMLPVRFGVPPEIVLVTLGGGNGHETNAPKTS
jgi:hypothetical protein